MSKGRAQMCECSVYMEQRMCSLGSNAQCGGHKVIDPLELDHGALEYWAMDLRLHSI